MSHWQPDSVLSRFNAAPPGSWQPLPAELYQVLEIADAIGRDSSGACDVTMGELVELWGFGPAVSWRDRAFRPPAPAQIAAALERCGAARIRLDPQTRSARQPGGLKLDLSGIAKGYAVDQIAGRLSREGFDHHLVDVGGELRGTGIKPDGQPWWVELETPWPAATAATVAPATSAATAARATATGTATATAGLAATRLALCGLSVATSGDYRRCYEFEGRRHAHTLDPRTGYPLDNDVAAVTVIARQAVVADALSTSLMVLGSEIGPGWADARGIAARWVRRDRDPGAPLVEVSSSAWRDMLA